MSSLPIQRSPVYLSYSVCLKIFHVHVGLWSQARLRSYFISKQGIYFYFSANDYQAGYLEKNLFFILRVSLSKHICKTDSQPITFLTLIITRFESKSDFAVNIKSCKKILAEKSLIYICLQQAIRVSCKIQTTSHGLY